MWFGGRCRVQRAFGLVVGHGTEGLPVAQFISRIPTGGKRFFNIFGVCAASLFAAQLAFAQQAMERPEILRTGLEMGPFRVHPSIAYTGEYDDNVFRNRFGKKPDYINHIKPAVQTGIGLGDHFFLAGIDADILRYSINNNLDAERYHATGSFNVNFPTLTAHLSEDFRRTDDFPTSQLTTRIRRNESILGAGGFYEIIPGRYGVGLDVTWEDKNYLRSDFDFLDQRSYSIAPSIQYKILPRAWVFGEYDLRFEHFRNRVTTPPEARRDNTKQGGQLGIRGDVTSTLRVTAKGGYQHEDIFDPLSRDIDSFVTSVQGTYRPAERLLINLVASRSVESSTVPNNPSFETFNALLSVRYAFSEKIGVNPFGSFGFDNFRQKVTDVSGTRGRKDFLFGGGLSITYQIQKWLSVEGRYETFHRNSNINIFDYDDNRYLGTITIGL